MGRYNILLEEPQKPTSVKSDTKIKDKTLQREKPPEQPGVQPMKDEKMNDRDIVINHDTMVSRNQVDIESIRKSVKQLGKEAATYRFTHEEKKVLADIVYSYRGRGIRTSENEVTRIAINSLIADYRENGENSTLAKVLARLNE